MKKNNTPQALLQIHNGTLCAMWQIPDGEKPSDGYLQLQFLQKGPGGQWLEEYSADTKFPATASPEELSHALQVCFDIYAYAMDLNNPKMGSHALDEMFDKLTPETVDMIRLGYGANSRIFENARFRIKWYPTEGKEKATFMVFQKGTDDGKWSLTAMNCATALPATAPFEQIQFASHEILSRLNTCETACNELCRNFDCEIVNLLEKVEEGITTEYVQSEVMLKNATQIQRKAFDKYLLWYLMKKDVTLDKLAAFSRTWTCANDGSSFIDYLRTQIPLPVFSSFLNNEYVDDTLMLQFLDYEAFAAYLEDRICA